MHFVKNEILKLLTQNEVTIQTSSDIYNVQAIDYDLYPFDLEYFAITAIDEIKTREGEFLLDYSFRVSHERPEWTEAGREIGSLSLCPVDELTTNSQIYSPVTNETDYLIQVGLEEARKLGAQDIGQAVVIEGINILARETRGGTNDLIRRASGLARKKRNLILVKAKKPGQDRRIDLPTMGLETVQLAAEHGFSGIAIEAGHSLFVDKERAIAAADAANLFIIGI